MAVTDQADRELQSRLRQAIGDVATERLLSRLGGLGDEQSSLDARMQVGFSELRAEMAELRAELKADMAELRGDFSDLRGEFGVLRGEFGDLRAEVAGIRADVSDRLEAHTRTMVVLMATFSGVIFGIARLV